MKAGTAGIILVNLASTKPLAMAGALVALIHYRKVRFVLSDKVKNPNPVAVIPYELTGEKYKADRVED